MTREALPPPPGWKPPKPRKRKRRKNFPYIRSVLRPGEKVIFATSLHWAIYLRGLFVMSAALGLNLGLREILTYALGSELANAGMKPMSYLVIVLTGFGCFLLLNGYLKLSSTELAVTNKRVIIKSGMFGRAAYEIFLDKVSGISIQENMLGRMFGFGTVFVRSYDSSLAPLQDVADPERFQEAILSQTGGSPSPPGRW